MNFNLPIEIGQKFRKMIIENFRSIDYAYRNLSDVIYKHKIRMDRARIATCSL